ncbi:alanine racemase [Paraconexibacter algicola]|uniref:Alanine racemase n=1 Tax=Paraconexibacter algicola TaxID=2133960 RepID=A0A2T4UF09_9ACTN|nr:alanine racemase [Paraconexibacter algicola]PTL56360.1 alanine racemase [Paraconexibacter algicola]
MERVEALVDVAAIGANVRTLRGRLAPGAAFAGVVKADGYGHGALTAARAAQAAGADWLAVVSAREARTLRDAGIAGPLLVMGALTPDELDLALGAAADVVAWTPEFLEAAARPRPDAPPARVHVKLDTGMGRLGTRDPDLATALVRRAVADDRVHAVGLMTHFATADEEGDRFMDEQLARYRAWAEPLKAVHPGLVRHVANSAATLRDPATHLDLVRCGIAIYGMDPANRDPERHGLVPALALRSVVAAVKPCARGESAGYGRRFVAERDTVLATVPIGYGDGWRRGLTNQAEVLIGGRRFAQVGTVSMDNVTVDLGPDGGGVTVGDPVTLLGADGGERILAETVAAALGTINYEVTCGLLPRATRRTVGAAT